MKINEPLAVEHGLITRLLNLVDTEVSRISRNNRIDKKFIDIVTDFFITYIDIAHHGKEENILFKWLNTKMVSKEHQKIMTELLNEHRLGRKIISELINAAENYASGSTSELPNIIARMQDFTLLYRNHIRKEDTGFFIECANYFTTDEQDTIVRNFWLLDIKLVHEKYKNIISLIETGKYAL